MNRFIDPIAQIVITDADTGDKFDWSAPDYPFLTAVKIEIERGRQSSLSFDIDAPYTTKILDSLVEASVTPFKYGNKVSGRIGYASGLWTPWYIGFIADGGQNITVDANGISGSIDVIALAGEVASANIPMELLLGAGNDAQKLFDGLCKLLGMALDISAKALGRISDNINAMVNTEEGSNKLMSLIGTSVWDVIKKTCKETQCTFIVSNTAGSSGFPSTLFIMTEDEAAQTAVERTYMIRGIISEENNQFPCFSFSPISSGLAWKANEQMPSGGGVMATAIDKETGEILEIPIYAEDQEEPISGSLVKKVPENTATEGDVSNIASTKRIFNDFVSCPIPPLGMDRLKRIALGYQSQGNPAQMGTIATLGIPEETTFNSCKLKGAGGLFDGVYTIQKLSHSYAPGTWDMTMEVKRGGSRSVSGILLETKGGQLNED